MPHCRQAPSAQMPVLTCPAAGCRYAAVHGEDLAAHRLQYHWPQCHIRCPRPGCTFEASPGDEETFVQHEAQHGKETVPRAMAATARAPSIRFFKPTSPQDAGTRAGIMRLRSLSASTLHYALRAQAPSPSASASNSPSSLTRHGGVGTAAAAALAVARADTRRARTQARAGRLPCDGSGDRAHQSHLHRPAESRRASSGRPAPATGAARAARRPAAARGVRRTHARDWLAFALAASGPTRARVFANESMVC